MRYTLPDRIASTFMRALYRGLAANKPLDQTLTEVRIALYFDHKDKNFWALPALYLRVDDGRVFE